MAEPQVRTFKDMDALNKELKKSLDSPVALDFIDVFEIESFRNVRPETETVVLVLSTQNSDPSARHLDRRRLVEFAKKILREFDPTFEDQILDALNRIESRLPEPSPKES